MANCLSLSKLLKNQKTFRAPRGGPDLAAEAEAASSAGAKNELKKLQLEMLRIQQGIFHHRKRAIVVFEGFDASGKGGAIRRLTEILDPRGALVHPIGPPRPDEQGKHYLYRFWTRLPAPGELAIFDRSWYGRVLVERVNRLTPKPDWKRAYQEINQFEAMLVNDGVDLVKIFLGISKAEQLKRFEDRLDDPYKQWKLQASDVEARQNWDSYVQAVDDLFARTDTRTAPWHLIAGDKKEYARLETLRIVTRHLRHHRIWAEKQAKEQNRSLREAKRALKALKNDQSNE